LLVGLVGNALAAPIGASGIAVPVHDFGQECQDPRYPALAGPWIVGCGPSGRVDRALSLESGRELRLPASLSAPALADGLVLSVGLEAAIIRLEESGARQLDLPLVFSASSAPPATNGTLAAMLSEGRASVWTLEDRSRPLYDARPAAWFPPALSTTHLAWVQDAGEDLEDIWGLDLRSDRPRPIPLALGPSSQRHVVGSGHFLAWVEPEAIVLLETDSGERTRIPARTGFSAPPSLWEGVVCWEERPTHPPHEEGDGVDILCSDRLRADGPGHQRWPSRFGPWLLYRQDGELWLRTAP